MLNMFFNLNIYVVVIKWVDWTYLVWYIEDIVDFIFMSLIDCEYFVRSRVLKIGCIYLVYEHKRDQS